MTHLTQLNFSMEFNKSFQFQKEETVTEYKNIALFLICKKRSTSNSNVSVSMHISKKYCFPQYFYLYS
jgi:hypothetical protein